MNGWNINELKWIGASWEDAWFSESFSSKPKIKKELVTACVLNKSQDIMTPMPMTIIVLGQLAIEEFVDL